MGAGCSQPRYEPVEGSFGQSYSVGKALGAGEVGIVYECFNKQTGKRAAVKFVERRGMSRAEEEAVYREVACLRQLKHRHILKLVDFFEDRRRFYLVTELCTGGELTHRITSKRKRRQPYTEKEARDVVRSLLLALYYCHSRGIVHRDVKPENILLYSQHDDHNIRLVDFGLAQRVDRRHGLTDTCGTACYMAPEMLSGGPYGTGVDVWGAGCVTFILLGGYHPFFCHDSPSMFSRIRAGQFEMRPKVFDAVSDEAKDLVYRMLEVDPERRLTALQALQHPWVCASDEVLRVRSLDTTLQDVLKRSARRRLRSAVLAVMIMQRMWREKRKALAPLPLPPPTLTSSTRRSEARNGSTATAAAAAAKVDMKDATTQAAATAFKAEEDANGGVSSGPLAGNGESAKGRLAKQVKLRVKATDAVVESFCPVNPNSPADLSLDLAMPLGGGLCE